MMTIQPANTTDHEILTNITKKSKAFWGYSEDLLLVWDDALTITEDYITKNDVYKFSVDESIVGYYSYIIKDEHNIKLDNLFLLPQFIGKGLGNYLITDFLNRIQNQNYKRVYLESEPYAEGFYKKHGFTTVDKLETVVKDRFMPVMELDL
ncbi:GNAT family N-acetyltransferase [Flavobacterium sp.]|uniref:GNAT family N-acetyltransferase n=1 Tax=Flavobacterium sp. TaxID=239 RepID=UPI0026235233|nr:GNAT family N-acetyltransferase [Flavobacterium sp.]